MNTFSLFSEPFTNALGWALVHTLWQATLLVAVTALVLRLTQQQPASVRYSISIGALAFQFLTFLVTGWVSYEPVRASMAIGSEQPAPATQTTLMLNLPATSDWLDDLTAGLNQYVPLLVTIWLVGTIVLLVRLLGGWVFVQRLTRRNINPAPEAWQNYLQQIARQLGISDAVRLMESTEITVPMTIGWLKPVVLIPIGLLAGLSPRQVEAVLAHELAHIRRYDYLVNLLQSVVEIVLFFHPAVWWLSARIREEREHCCDDVAIQLCGERASLAQALVHIEERRQAVATTPSLAMAFGARRPSFLQRVKRVIGLREPQAASRPNGLAVAGFLVLLAGLVTAQHRHRSGHVNRPATDSMMINTWPEFAAVGPFVAQDTNGRQPLVPLVVIENDTIDPVERAHIESQIEEQVQEMERLGQEMEEMQLEKFDKQLELQHRALELNNQEMEKLHEKLEKLHTDLDGNLQRSVELELKQSRLNGKLSEAESKLLEKSKAMAARAQQQIEQVNSGEMARLQKKMQALLEGPMKAHQDTMKTYMERVFKDHNILVAQLTREARKLDSLREKLPPVPAIAPTPDVRPIPAAPAAPARVPGPARADKPAKGKKGEYWYNGKRYDNPADMPAAPAPPIPPAEPSPATVADPVAPAVAPAVPTPPQFEAVPDAPAAPRAPKSGKKGRHTKTED
ncbi:M56 family metallopeptidase [Larkinella insperata]|uniref:M56 family metallopeptidase n=1 Tax=Larkinella insperata TaxID=332158 RepID=A0ABW3Q9U0_9BACT|nr:M56 family metallopeptidase [Larkinella insperata]